MQTLLVFSLATLVASLYWRNRSRYRLPLPPGPTRLPIIGSLLSLPSGFEWKTYAEWSREYRSDILYMNIFGTDIVILNSREHAIEFLDKRSRISSGRPYSWMIACILECDWVLNCLPNNDAWRISRRLLAKYFSRSLMDSRNAVVGFTDYRWQRPHVVKYTHYFLRNLLWTPDSFMDHTVKLAGSVSISSTYGIDVAVEDDKYVGLARKAIEGLVAAVTPGRFLIDTFPLLRFCPEWVSFKQQAKFWREDLRAFLDIPFFHAKENMAAPSNSMIIPSVISEELHDIDMAEEHILQKALASMSIGGTSTTAGALNVFFLTMTLYPAKQKRAQAEIDAVMAKHGRQIPTHDDFASLPFCMAVVYEILRWHVLGPIGLPHLTTEECSYHGYRIPKGSVIIPNIWAMMQDPRKFPHPLDFLPERFLNSDGTLDEGAIRNTDLIWGFGRRVCVGKSLALSILMYAVCGVLAAFDISKKVGDRGDVVEPRMEFEPAVTSVPLPFLCAIKPRSLEAEKLVLELCVSCAR